MKTISEIYDEYNIIPNLREHMLRVAGVAAWVCDHTSEEVQKQLHRDEIISACLLHDMGNIIKFDFEKTKKFYPEIDIPYWEIVKKDFIARYGTNEHQVHVRIAKDLGVSPFTQECIDGVGFDRVFFVLDSKDFSKYICAYADLRVVPQGVVSVVERISDGIVRYGMPEDQDKREEREKFHQGVFLLEKEIEKQLIGSIAAITDASVAPYCEKFLDFTPV